MKSLVVYSTQTDNTKKLAQAIYDSLSEEKEISFVGDAPDPVDYDFITVGFWLMAGKPDPKAVAYLEKMRAGQKIFLFATHGAAKGSAHASQAMQIAKEIVKKADVLGTYSCQGEVNPNVMAKAKSKPQPPVWLEDAATAVGHPDEGDLEELKNIIATVSL